MNLDDVGDMISFPTLLPRLLCRCFDNTIKNSGSQALDPIADSSLSIKEGGVGEHVPIEDLLEHQVGSEIRHSSCNISERWI